MSLTYLDRVKETSLTSGTGTYALAGAVQGFRAFSAVGNGNTCYYAVTDGNDWEVGLGTYASGGNTLARTSILASSNAGAAVSWGAGTKSIWLDLPALVATTLTAELLYGATNGPDARVLLSVPPFVTSRVALKALDTAKDTRAVFDGSVWEWTLGDYTARAAVDTAEGCTVKATAVLTSVGAWIRRSETLNPFMFGVVANGVDVVVTASITSGAAALTATGAAFTVADIGKRIVVPGAGTAGAPLATTISGFTDATHVTLGANAATSLVASSQQIAYGTDDAAALQAYANFCGYSGAEFRLTDTPLSYITTAKITFKTTRDLAPSDTTPPSDVHFTDALPFKVTGFGKAKVTAAATMTSIFELIFDTVDSDIGPFYTEVRGVQFDGCGLATSGVVSNYTMHVSYENNRFDRLVRGLDYTGYGVFRATHNVFRCKYGIYSLGGGGDSEVTANDFYAPENNSAAIYLGYFAGDAVIADNIITNEGGYTNAYGVFGDGSSAPASEETRHVIVRDNEFCGLTAGINGVGKGSGNKNLWNWIVKGNHTTPFGASNPGTLVIATDFTDLLIEGNFLNSIRLGATATQAIVLSRTERAVIIGNKFGNIGDAAVLMTDCIDTDIEHNEFYDCGTLGASYAVVNIFGSSSARNLIRSNRFRQSSASYAQNGIFEQTGVDGTTAYDNGFVQVNTPMTQVGATSRMLVTGQGLLGYDVGSGGAVTQATSKSTGVTLNKATGEITLNAAALAAATIVSFTLTDLYVGARDVLVLNHVSGGTLGAYGLNAACGAGSAVIYVRNNTAGSLSEAIILRFDVMKGSIT